MATMQRSQADRGALAPDRSAGPLTIVVCPDLAVRAVVAGQLVGVGRADAVRLVGRNSFRLAHFDELGSTCVPEEGLSGSYV